MNKTDETETFITIFTIGYTQKSAKEFFELLHGAGVRKVFDVRLNNVSQLAGFTKKNDLEYFLDVILNAGYIHKPEWAPTKEILDSYKNKNITWQDYEEEFQKLLLERQIEEDFSIDELDHGCLLCSEPSPEKCHRRLLAEFIKKNLKAVNIRHL